ncbi:T9SS type A sorting domain-containing protein [Hymenobacter wooponensis]|uniref:T9SS type A sorting domain-containing protein n=1 Tax=Hymenobacter wooponensis TaxID=1525360 RepID=A0A4Z0MRA7_9BACT|nr:T9SS type A sorting domain-containing protein [Hymenobacter wooponensis]TGD82363.1 T9SS type A sorting domain-containing protein [Hymenobacter wooponensis]
MLKVSTLALSGAFALTALTSQAQITVDGVLNTAEISSTNYQLVGRYTGSHGFGDMGIVSLYSAADANKLYFFLAGTLESNAATGTTVGSNSSFQLFIDRPDLAGASSAAPLPVVIGSRTAFQKMSAKLDMDTDLAIAVTGTGTGGQLVPQAIVYTSATAATDKTLGADFINGTSGAVTTISASDAAGSFTALAGARMAYRNTPDGKLSSNPGNTTGGAGSYGWEIEVDRAAMNIPATGGTIRIFALQSNSDGGYISSDFIPQNTAPLPTDAGYPLPGSGAPNLGGAGNNPPNVVDFANIPGIQAATLTIGAAGGTVLGAKKADELAVAMSAYPNPVTDALLIKYFVTDRVQTVTISLLDMMGRQVHTVIDAQRAVGQYQAEIKRGRLTAGMYIVRVQVGERVAARQVVVK